MGGEVKGGESDGIRGGRSEEREREREWGGGQYVCMCEEEKGNFEFVNCCTTSCVSTLCLPDITHVTGSSTSISAYCKVIRTTDNVFFMHVHWEALCNS